MSPDEAWPPVGYLTVTQHWVDGTRTSEYNWRGGPQLLVNRQLFLEMDRREWDGCRPPTPGERGRLATFPVRVVGYDAANDWYVLMREDGDGGPQRAAEGDAGRAEHG